MRARSANGASTSRSVARSTFLPSRTMGECSHAVLGMLSDHRCPPSARLPTRLAVARPAQRKNARRAVVVEANLFARVVRIFKSYANQAGELDGMPAISSARGAVPCLTLVLRSQ